MKNKLMRAATILMVLTLMTSCFVGSTFAKYTTTASGTDTARVAYWGWKTTSLDIDLFDTSYDQVNSACGDYDPTGTDNVIAPGTTKGTSFAFAYTNYKTDKVTAPEVGYSFTISADTSVIADDIKNNASIVWALDPADHTDAAEYGTWQKLLDDIKLLSGDASGTKEYGPNELPTAFAPGTSHTVYWMWKFDGNDAGDTALGIKAAMDTVTLTINIAATQLDS